MKTRSAKAKGRRLQDWVRDVLVGKLGFPPASVRTAIMGEAGADVQVHVPVQSRFPYYVECKNVEGFKKVFDVFQSTEDRASLESLVPMVVLKINNNKPLVVLDAEKFILHYKHHYIQELLNDNKY